MASSSGNYEFMQYDLSIYLFIDIAHGIKVGSVQGISGLVDLHK